MQKHILPFPTYYPLPHLRDKLSRVKDLTSTFLYRNNYTLVIYLFFPPQIIIIVKRANSLVSITRYLRQSTI